MGNAALAVSAVIVVVVVWGVPLFPRGNSFGTSVVYSICCVVYHLCDSIVVHPSRDTTANVERVFLVGCAVLVVFGGVTQVVAKDDTADLAPWSVSYIIEPFEAIHPHWFTTHQNGDSNVLSLTMTTETEEEALFGQGALQVDFDSASRDDEVHVRMIDHGISSPGVQHAEVTQFTAAERTGS